ncbi:hypothetical protein Poli38472_006873 [Pythium oligandrum]|uniref:Chromodomain-helicase-DNA-binding protein 6 n=1 Tax=Pythium oligandrum TaxID=41045 RepID=A0A8K1FFJ2_PYTOL|nr:hypothetical protein Poli38472_006873 [Pythium oligandrum]|eukprot:TMW56863.1 hypothetical protein Poli38472_006873 [Pythium oligandrum]
MEATQYCVCQQVDSGIMIECIRGEGGCNGWVHPACCGLLLTPEELEAIDSYICPLCEKPGDDFTKMKALNTKLANKLVTKQRKKKTSTTSSTSSSKDDKPWRCKECGFENASRAVDTCGECQAVRSHKRKSASSSASSAKKEKPHHHQHHHHDDKESEEDAARRRSGREANKKRKNYHVPNSDEDLSMDEDDDGKKKRGVKGKKRKRDNDDAAGGDESDEAEFQAGWQRKPDDQAAATPTMVIEKIMAVRKREVKEGDVGTDGTTATAPPLGSQINEYYIKWKGFSYLHSSWESRDVLLGIDPGNKQRIKRFHEKEHPHHHHQRVFSEDMEEEGEMEYFNPEYLEIHRVISHRQDAPVPADPEFPDAPVDDGLRYLVKWRVLPYTDATWERACDLKDDAAIEKYKMSLDVPPKEEWEPLPRPTIREYRKLEESPTFGADNSLKLRAYQLEGLNWLLWNWYNERPSILADEMGLGKTIQTLAFLDRMRRSDKIMCRGPFLVVAPLSLIAQWQSECETWTTMNCVVYHGNTEAREIIRDFEFYYMDSQNRPDKKKPFKFNILVTTYEVAIKDISILSKIRWRCLVVDEAHRLKNQSSRLVEQLRSLRRDHCVLLTGTPLQNKTEELWALLNFLDGKSFPSVTDFLDKFGDLHEAQQVADLHKMLKPYLLRRVKEDVEKSLPPKEETIIEVELTPVQKQWYRAIYERNTAFLSRGGNPNNVPNLMNVMMELRKCCNHPYLNNGVEERLNEGLETDDQRHQMMVKCCGKMVLLDKLLPRLKEGGHKVLIFSQMVRVLDIIEDYLRYMGYIHERLDGNIRGNDRQAAVDRFVKPEYNRFVMLLSTKAGGLGLNLTAADTVIIFDSDWNPQNDLQAQARAHRIGQTHSVKIYRLITRKTYEMHMFHKASLKLGLDKAVLTHMRRENEDQKEGGAKKKSSKAQEAKEIDELLKRGAYDVFRDDDSAGEQFCAADIDQILQRSSQIVQYEQEAKSSFSKASFVSATTSDDVDIDDPDFWKKAVGLDDPEPTESADALPLQRKRTRVSRFGTGNQAAFDSDDDEDFDRRERELERKEREREERERADEKREPRDWTLNGRDRLQRALMHFGFGRWEIIRSQSGGSRTVDEIEQFAREFIYVCGLSGYTEQASSSKDDSPFIKSLIRASMFAQKEGLVDENEMPPVLKDEDFVLKLKQGGGRRVLIRLDMLWRLSRLITSACDELDAEYYASNPKTDEVEKEEIKPDEKGDESKSDEESKTTARSSPPPATAELDDRVAYYGVDAVCQHIKLADVGDRPSWTLITPWWDEEADRCLLIGVFLHGYGRCSQILGDSRLRFAQIAQAAKERDGVGADDASGSDSKTEKQSKDEDEVMSDADSDDETSTVNGDDEPANSQPSGSKTSKKDSSGGATATSSSANGEDNKSAYKQPEVQQMNRLLFWLLSVDDLKRQKEMEVYKKERAGIEQQRQASLERKQRAAALRRVELKAMQLAQMDILRHLAIVRNAKQMPDPVIGSKIKPKDWTKEERRTFSYLLALHGAPRILAKSVDSLDVSEEAATTHGDVPRFAWQTDSLSWMNIVQWGRLNKTAAQARAFYEDRFLPKCHEIASMKVDPLGSDQRAMALADLVGIEFVDAHEGVLAHGLKARNTAWVTLRRVQLLEDLLVILSEKKIQVQEYLRSGKPELVQDMPVWWCPWIHDLYLMFGMARYGIYGWEKILLDRRLPFHRQALEEHIRRVFLDGTETFAPLYRDRFDSDASREAWLQQVVEEFPSFAVLERKVQAICEELLREELNGMSDVDEERYYEPALRREYSMPAPGNALETQVLARIKHEDRVVRNPFLELTKQSVAEELAACLAASPERRDAYLRDLITSSPFTTTNGHAAASNGASEPTPMEEDPASDSQPPATSQIPIHMLVS